jgi:hypothetical protein
MSEGERRSTGGAGGGTAGRPDSWRALGRRAVRIARQRELGGKALLLGADAVGGALAGAFLTARGAAPPRPAPRGPATGTALVWVVVRVAFR